MGGTSPVLNNQPNYSLSSFNRFSLFHLLLIVFFSQNNRPTAVCQMFTFLFKSSEIARQTFLFVVICT